MSVAGRRPIDADDGEGTTSIAQRLPRAEVPVEQTCNLDDLFPPKPGKILACLNRYEELTVRLIRMATYPPAGGGGWHQPASPGGGRPVGAPVAKLRTFVTALLSVVWSGRWRMQTVRPPGKA